MLEVYNNPRKYLAGYNVYLSIRPENVHFADCISDFNTEKYNAIEAIYDEEVYIGNISRHILHTSDGHQFKISRFTRKGEHFERGQKIKICWSKKRCVIVHDEGGGPTDEEA